MRFLISGLAASLVFISVPKIAAAQFVYPKPEENVPQPGIYTEDPFIVKYRQKFFSVFRGDLKTFNAAYAEIEDTVKKDPRDARALVWLGNGQTVKAATAKFLNPKADATQALAESRRTLDRAVALRPQDPNIYMMRAATLYIQGQVWTPEQLPKIVWETLRDDCNRFIKFIGPKRMPLVSIHVRGEAYGELGIAYVRLGDKTKARETFKKLIEISPNTRYAERAQKELEALDKQ